MFTIVGNGHDFIDVNITSPCNECTWLTRNIVNLQVWLSLLFICQVAYRKLWRSVRICKSYCEKNEWHLSLFGHSVYLANVFAVLAILAIFRQVVYCITNNVTKYRGIPLSRYFWDCTLSSSIFIPRIPRQHNIEQAHACVGLGLWL